MFCIGQHCCPIGGQSARSDPALRQSRAETETGKDARGQPPRARARRSAADKQPGTAGRGHFAGRYEGCLQKKGSPSGA
jgi:hypothetical protein